MYECETFVAYSFEATHCSISPDTAIIHIKIIKRALGFESHTRCSHTMTSPHQRADLVNNITEWEENGKKAISLNTRAINIIWGGEASKDRYWKRTIIKESEDKGFSFEVVELLGVYWLELTGKIPLNLLSPGTTYTFSVTLKLTPNVSGWENNLVMFRLSFPGDTAKVSAVELSSYSDGEWVDVPNGGLVFTVPQDNSYGMLSFAIYEFEGEEWKKGVIVKNVKFVPQAPQADLRTII
ncbi:uncharacterized protein A4U43_C03F10480 [Asparagus officinalis]|uniref:Uncharacterized protein n=1 Tax=Asparagus officinalis TaxID=4686 RepID=A0A5P1FDY6_ASPOF|nr:protein PHLOEM PROTEIN 2-LIKE A6-like [Asparagus officinalis]ONK74821.1 uncharacterized protein A4U43_C03F10480 [Asparagus officinalis]